MIARLGLSSREIQTAVLVAFRWKEILVSFKMVLKYRDKEISSLEDIQNLTAKDLRENSLISFSIIPGISFKVSKLGYRSIVFRYEHNARQDENAVRYW